MIGLVNCYPGEHSLERKKDTCLTDVTYYGKKGG